MSLREAYPVVTTITEFIQDPYFSKVVIAVLIAEVIMLIQFIRNKTHE